MVDRVPIPFDRRMRDTLLPMHMRVSASGHISETGPTLRKLRDEGAIRGRRLLEVFELLRPAARKDMDSG